MIEIPIVRLQRSQRFGHKVPIPQELRQAILQLFTTLHEIDGPDDSQNSCKNAQKGVHDNAG